MHKDLKKTPYKIAHELKKNEQTVHNVIEKYEKTELFMIDLGQEENGSFQRAS